MGVQPTAYFERSFDDGAPGYALARVQIEDQPVGLFEIVGRGAPWMDFKNAGLNQIDQAVEAVDHQHLLLLADIDAPHGSGEAMPGVLGKEAFLAGARRTAQKAQDPSGNMRKNPIGNVSVEFGQPFLGDAGLGPENSLRVSKLFAHRLAATIRIGFSGWRLQVDL